MRFLLLVLVLLLPIPGLAKVLTGKTIWNGVIEVAETTRIERGAELIVEPGTKVLFQTGSLEVAGRLQADGAQFSGQDWQGWST